MTRDNFIAILQAWMRARGFYIARENEHMGIATLHGTAEYDALLDYTRVLDDAVKYGLEQALRPTEYAVPATMTVPVSRTITPKRAATVTIPPEILAAAIAASREPS